MKRMLFVGFFIFSCGSGVSENIPVPGITTGPLDLTVKDLCGNPIKDLEVYVSGILEPVKTDEKGNVYIKNVFKPYFITFKREEPPFLTYRSGRTTLEIFDLDSFCERSTASLSGSITIPSSVTGPVTIFAYPGGITESSVDNGKGEYSMELKLFKVPTSVSLVGVFYENGEVRYLGRSNLQITGYGQSINSSIDLRYEPIITLGGKITTPSRVNEKVEASYSFLFNERWNPEPIYKKLVQPPIYELKLPNPDMLSEEDGFIVIGRALEIDERGTPSDESDDEVTSSVSVNFIEKSSVENLLSLDISFHQPPSMLEPSSDGEFENLPDVKWNTSSEGLSIIEFRDSNGKLLWRVVLDGGEKEVSPSKVPEIETITSRFSSLRHYFVSLYIYPLDLSQMNTIFLDGEWRLFEKKGYSFVQGRRFYLK